MRQSKKEKMKLKEKKAYMLSLIICMIIDLIGAITCLLLGFTECDESDNWVIFWLFMCAFFASYVAHNMKFDKILQTNDFLE